MKRLALALGLIIALFAAATMQHSASALSGNDWRAGRIIDMNIFRNSTSMSVQDIQNFLNAKVPSCDTWGTKPSEYGGGTRAQYGSAHGVPPPYTCLRDYTQNGKTAAQIIFDYAQTYRINPQVLIALLQKEQTLVTDDWPWPIQYRSATGYGCPDNAACDSQYYGFDNQVRWAARMYQAISDNDPNWFSPYLPGSNFIQWNPINSCGGSNVNIEARSTAALYSYTPYQPNATALSNIYGSQNDGCSSYGNRNFWRLFNDWFGPSLNIYDDIVKPGNYEGTQCPVLSATGNAYKVYCTSPVSGDFNGDGYDDIAVLSVYPDNRSFNLWLFPGSASGIGNPVLQQHFDAANYWDVRGIKVAASDLNHDGRSDLVMFAANGYGGVTTAQIMGASGGLTSAAVFDPNVQFDSGDGWLWSNLEVLKTGGDINGDGYEDILAMSVFPDKHSFNLWLFPGSASGMAKPVFQQHFDVSGYWDMANLKTALADLNHDGHKDLVMFANNASGGITTVQLMGAANGLKGTPVIRSDRQYGSGGGWSWASLEIVRTGGDVNGDGYEDIVAVSDYPDKRSFNLWLFPGAADGLANPILQQHFDSKDYWNISAIKMEAADLNHDGKSDLVMFAGNAGGGITTVQLMGAANGLQSSPIIDPARQYTTANGWSWARIR